MDPNNQHIPSDTPTVLQAVAPGNSATNPSPPPPAKPSSSQATTVAGVPLSQIKDAVAEQRQQKPTTTILTTTQPSRAMEIGLVGLQLTALVVVLFGFIPPILWQNTFLQVFGMLLVGGALFIAVWAVVSFRQKLHILPTPNPSGFLVTGGPYAFVRHPLYLALVVGGVGIFLAYPTIPRLLALLLLMYVLHVKMELEESMLAQQYNGYEKYRQHTGKLLPKMSRPKSIPTAPSENEQPNKEI